jgi:hypothetical protein
LVRKVVMMILKSSLNRGCLGLKTRSHSSNIGKPVNILQRTVLDQISLKLVRKVILIIPRPSLNMGRTSGDKNYVKHLEYYTTICPYSWSDTIKKMKSIENI